MTTKIQAVGLLVLALAGCSSTSRPSATPVVVTPAPVVVQDAKPPREMVTVGPMPAAPSTFAAGSAGLPPDALLRHASEYGAWCQTSAAKLRALEAFFWPQDK